MAGQIIDMPADLDEYYDFVQVSSWSDGLPTIPPTPERIEAFLARVARDPDEVLAVLPPYAGAATVRAVAVNAVLAGCRPEYFPVVIAAVQAIAEPQLDLHSLQVDVNAATIAVIVNGPVRTAIGMNFEGDVLGGGNRANATIGRAIRLAMRNIGGARAPYSDLTIHGQPGRISLCIAEDEEGSPWEPLHVSRGFAPSDSVVTVTGVTGTQNVLTGVHNPDEMLTLIADSICTMASNTVLLGAIGGGPVVLMSKHLARLLHRDGLSKQDVQRILFERARRPQDQLPMTKRPDRINQVIFEDGYVHALRAPDQAVIVVCGYDSPNHCILMPNYCVTDYASRTVELAD